MQYPREIFPGVLFFKIYHYLWKSLFQSDTLNMFEGQLIQEGLFLIGKLPYRDWHRNPTTRQALVPPHCFPG